MSIPIRLRIEKTRTVRDKFRGKKFLIADRFPGGRKIVRAKAETRGRAFKAALHAAVPQTGISAASGAGSLVPETIPQSQSEAMFLYGWKLQLEREISMPPG